MNQIRIPDRFEYILRNEFLKVKRAFSNLLFPPFCPICENELNRHERFICEECYSRIESIESHYCQKCGAPLKKNRKTCHVCKGLSFRFERVRALGVFSTPLVEMIHYIKYERKFLVAERLGIHLGNLLLSEPDFTSSDMIIPVPLHRTRMRERGYNQSLLLARKLSEISKIEVFPDIVIRKKATKSQTTLSDNERIENLKNAFSVTNRGSVKERNIVIVDDVMTSGITLSELAGTLRDAGAKRVYGLVLARTLHSKKTTDNHD
jgi:ComF family protein